MSGSRRGVWAVAAGVVVALVALVVVLATHDGGSASDPSVLSAGQVDIRVPDGWKVVDGKVVRPAGSGSGGGVGPSSATGVSGTTVPLANKTDPTSDMFAAMGKFRSCLDGLGVKFIGAPDSSNPSSPANDPEYLKSLSTCAARSNIVQALSAAQAANDALTPDEIKTRNAAYLKWRECMIGRGWKIPTPAPDEKGRLFTFSTQSGTSIVPPAGKDIITSTDTQECIAKVQKPTAKKN
ncbi:MAG: hypothetical protein WCI50_10605 [Actinomycetes bacterium]